MPEIKADNKKIAKNTLFLYGRMLFTMIVSLYTTRVVLSTLGVEDFGIYNVVGGVVSMLAFLNSALVSAIQRFYNVENSRNGDDGIQRVYSVAIVVQCLLSLVIFVLLESLGIWYVNNMLVVPAERLLVANVLFQVSTISLLLTIFQTPYSAAIVSFERLDYFAYVGIIDVVLKLVFALILPFIPFDHLMVYSLLILCINVLNFQMNFIYARSNFKMLRFKRAIDRPLLKSMLSFSGWNTFDAFSSIIYGQGLNLILNLFFGPVVNAARGVANQINAAISGFSRNIVMAFRPQLVDSYAKGDYQRTRTIMFTESKVCFFMLFLLSLPVIIQIHYILHLWLGDNVPDYTEIFVQLILIKMIIATFNVPFSQVVHATGNIKKFHLITGNLTILIAPISYLFLKIGCDATIVFIISIVMSVVTQIVCVFVLKGLFEYSIFAYLKEIVFPCAIVALIAPLLPLLLDSILDENFVSFIIVSVVCVISSVIVSMIILMDRAQRNKIMSNVARRITKR